MSSEFKSNPWQLSSFLLIGLLIGLGIGKVDSYIKAPIIEKQQQPAVVQQPVQPPSQPAEPTPAQIVVQPIGEDDHVRGAEDPELIFVEFSDIDCPFCKSFHPTMQQLMDEYGDKVQWVYRHFPLDSLHPNARAKAEATECAAEQDKFWEMLDNLIANEVALADLSNVAKELGLDVTDFEECVENREYKDKIDDQVQQAAAAGGRGTPYTVVLTKDGQKIPFSGAQPYAQVEQVVLQNL